MDQDETCPSHIVLDGDPASSAEESGTTPPISAHVCCGQTAGWIKIPVGRDVELGPGDIVSDRDPLKRGTSPPLFGPCLWPNGRPFQLLLRACFIYVNCTVTVESHDVFS